MENSFDRDQYIKINWENIKDGAEKHFEKFHSMEATRMGLPYDYTSLSHFGQYAFSKNGKPTITTLVSLCMRYLYLLKHF